MKSIILSVLLVTIIILWRPDNSSMGAITQESDQAELYLPLLMKNSPMTAQLPAIVQGYVMSGIPGEDNQINPIENAVVCLKNTVLCSSPTDSSGFYIIDRLTYGTNTLVVTAPGYARLERTLNLLPYVAPDYAVNNINLQMSPQLPAGQYRVILSWLVDVDLDAHLWLPPPENPAYHVARYLGLPGNPDENEFPYAYIDIDSGTFTQPETISLYRGLPGIYTYAVQHYPRAAQLPYAYSLIQSLATVELYDSSGLIASFQVPTEGDPLAIWWKVFTLEFEEGPGGQMLATLHVVNTISSDLPVGTESGNYWLMSGIKKDDSPQYQEWPIGDGGE